MIIPTHPTYWGRVFTAPKITFSAELPPAQQKSATRGKNYLSYPPTAGAGAAPPRRCSGRQVVALSVSFGAK